ncbi:NAD(P)/FAD-dependent oxidoreductase [Alloiococcus sp. CFN-8]|uniref:NAD(P)/FAD-dependent oxidoreductase n=1 Tax=Alloiococcus sp. CFN-8 TaxID=3416081 RepID=UPI003CE9F111
MIYHDLIIIGGGASGLMAAILAKDYGIDTAIVEGSDRVGKKILTTGNGRCNVTNKYISSDFREYHSDNEGFYTHTLKTFTVQDTINFFQGIGLPLTTLEEGKMYPMSLQASSVLDRLRFAVEDRAIPVYLNSKVKSISKGKKSFKLSTSSEENPHLSCGKLLMACGGNSLPGTGSDGSGFALASSLGHSIIKPVPALVQLKLNYPHLKALSGIKFIGVGEVIVDNKVLRKEAGEILFTDYGISGPPILQLSRIASKSLLVNKEVKIKVDMFPGYDEKELMEFFENHLGLMGHRSVSEAFIGIINKKLITTILREAGVMDIHKASWDLDYEEKLRIVKLLKGWTFSCIGNNGFNNSQATAGGVDTHDVNPETLESKLIANLYFCGEILDVDGDCGGFNLQWAWSSAYTAVAALSK